SVQETEKGGITQKISFTSYPAEQLKKTCPLIESSGIKLDIPGFLLIDTPGHAAFTNLRKRGGSLADLAVLVIDINEGIKPQTAEVIQILKHNKTPFLIALNKIDNISGWRTDLKMGLKENIESQAMNIQNTFNERYMTLIGSLNSYGFDSDLYFNITDFTKKIALIPCSARTQQGIPELIMMLCGLSQKYLASKLKLGEDAKGVVLEIKKERSGNYAEAILYDGQLKKSDQIALSNIDGKPLIAKIRVLEEIESLSAKFRPKQLSESVNSLLEKHGIIAKADSLGSLEALLFLLKQNNIPVLRAGIGNIKKTDIISAKANIEINELNAVVLGFNISIDEEAGLLLKEEKIKVLTNDVIYKLIEDVVEFRKQKAKEIEKERLMELASLFKIKILHQFVFRNLNPAIFGIRVEAGKIKKNLTLIDEKGEKIGRVKNIQSEKKSIEEAGEGMEIAISIPGVNFERVLKDKNYLYSDISEQHFRNFKKNKDLLSVSELKTLQEIAEIKRKKEGEWGT
ncbi:50S ribosome-binding GTPase, partial [Candidatus Pacearchaeota archaeon]|nr:50S ribosome-binding GTPase [Candidatus Pacearchaeota archaeon]